MLSLTFVPAAVALFMTGHIEEKDNFIVRHSNGFTPGFGVGAKVSRSRIVCGPDLCGFGRRTGHADGDGIYP